MRPAPSPDDGTEVAAGELLVRPAPGRDAELDAALALLPEVHATRVLVGSGLRRVRLAPGVSLGDGRALVSGLAAADEVELNAVARGAQTRGHGRRRHDRAARSDGPDWFSSAIGPIPGRARLTGRSGHARFVVAILDSGVASRDYVDDDGLRHAPSPGLAGVERAAPFDAVDGDTEPDDRHGHGTFLANLIAGRPGIAGGVALMPIRVLDDELVGTEADLVEGLLHAAREGADVVNLSLVFSEDYVPTRALDEAILEVLESGAVVVAAAGNGGDARVRYPAALPGVLAVGASTLSSTGGLARTGYSSFGPALDVLAPGGDLDADANADGVPDGILAESFDPSQPDSFGPWLYAGTSQAAASASAVAALALAMGQPPSQVLRAIREGARDAGAPGFDVETGGGLLWLPGATASARPVLALGVQIVPSLYDAGTRTGIGAMVTLLDSRERPVAGATVHARFRGAESELAHCVTDRSGGCVMSAVLRSGTDVSLVEIPLVVDPTGRAVRPATLASAAAIDAAIEGVGFGPSSVLWYLPSTWSSSFTSSLDTWAVYGSGAGSALAPSVLVLDEAAATALLSIDTGTGGTGFGPSSILWTQLLFQPSFSFSFVSSVGGTGFGPSSISWSGWSFLWTGGSTSWSFTQVLGGSLGRLAPASVASGAL